MERRHIANLETQIRSLCTNLAQIADHADFGEFIRIIPRHGWTTPAEAMLTRTTALAGHKQALLTRSQAVGTPA